jgi:signal transduction histidine kinase
MKSVPDERHFGVYSPLKEPKLTGDEQQYISIIEKSGNRMLNIINNIVSISKIESGQMNLSYRETSVKNQMESLYNTSKLKLSKKILNLK